MRSYSYTECPSNWHKKWHECHSLHTKAIEIYYVRQNDQDSTDVYEQDKDNGQWATEITDSEKDGEPKYTRMRWVKVAWIKFESKHASSN